MRRVLIPLDGTSVAASILPDAKRIAGKGGELVLVQDVILPYFEYGVHSQDAIHAARETEMYLQAQAAPLRSEGFQVETHALLDRDTSWAIETASKCFRVDMIACATRGRTPLGRLIHGGTAWKVLTYSSVPIMFRHAPVAGEQGTFYTDFAPRRIMVPLDGSNLAETAIPLAQQLAMEWNASLCLVRVAQYPLTAAVVAWQTREFANAAQAYLDCVARTLVGDVHTRVLVGPIVHSLVDDVGEQAVTDIVMASHGRSGLQRVLLGSVADGLIHNLPCSVVVVPATSVRPTTARRDVLQSAYINTTR